METEVNIKHKGGIKDAACERNIKESHAQKSSCGPPCPQQKTTIEEYTLHPTDRWEDVWMWNHGNHPYTALNHKSENPSTLGDGKSLPNSSHWKL